MKGEGCVTDAEGKAETRAQLENPRDTKELAQPGERRGQLIPQSPRRDHPCQHLDLGLLAPCPVREHTSAVGRRPVCGLLLQQAQETNAGLQPWHRVTPWPPQRPPLAPTLLRTGRPCPERAESRLPPEEQRGGPEGPGAVSSQLSVAPGGSPFQGTFFHSISHSLTEQLLPGQVDSSSLHSVRTCSMTLGMSLPLCLPQQPCGVPIFTVQGGCELQETEQAVL